MTMETRQHFSKQRLYCDVPLDEGMELTLNREQSHYLINVLRYQDGQELLVFNGRDGEYLAVITLADRKKTQLKCCDQTRAQDTMPKLTLIFAPIKKARIDFIAEKATELGVGIIQPVMTDYTQVSRVNTDRMAANAIEAAEQTGRTTVPVIAPVISLRSLLEDWPEGCHIIFCDEDNAGNKDFSFHQQVTSHQGPAAILIGPEGGFSPREREMIRSHNAAVPVSLGHNILRADTAMLAALSLWQGIAGDWKDA